MNEVEHRWPCAACGADLTFAPGQRRLVCAHCGHAQTIPAPDRGEGEGDGPFQRLIIRGAIVIDGTGAPPAGPTDIVIEGNRIRQIRSAGAPGVQRQRTPQADADHVIDAQGMYVLPGFVDLHGHTGGGQQGTPAEYVYKLWMAHGITTVREPGSGNGVDWTLRSRERSAKNEITAPRVFVYVRPGSGWNGGAIDSPEKARDYVRWAKQKGVDGFKLGSHDPDIMEALLDEAHRVLAPQGRALIIVPNRTGLWSSRDATPFGFGRPYSRRQIEQLLQECGFVVTGHASALFFPPSGKRFWLRSARGLEQLGRRYAPARVGGVLIIEAIRRDTAPTRPGLRAEARRPLRVLEGVPQGGALPAWRKGGMG